MPHTARLLVLFSLLAACASAEEDAAWRTETALAAPAKLNGCAIGDVDPRWPGREIAVVAAGGEVFVVRRDGDGWKHERVARVDGEMIQCAIGDVDPRWPGRELAVVGMKTGEESAAGPGAAYVVRFDAEAGAWKTERVFEDPRLIHGVCIGDLDPDRPGREMLCVGFSARATLVARDGDTWKAMPAGELAGAGKTAVPYRGGAAVACQSGALVHMRKTAGGWTSKVLDRAPGGRARIATDGRRLLCGRDDGALDLVAPAPDGSAGKRLKLHQEQGKLRGAALGDVDPDAPGLEAATAGYSGRVTVLYPQENGG